MFYVCFEIFHQRDSATKSLLFPTLRYTYQKFHDCSCCTSPHTPENETCITCVYFCTLCCCCCCCCCLLFTLFFFRVFPRSRSLHWFENFCSVHLLLRVCQNRNYRREFCLIYKSIDIRFYRCCCCGSPPCFSVCFPLSCHQLATSSSSLHCFGMIACVLHENRFLH